MSESEDKAAANAEDIELMRQTQAGALDAFERLVRRHQQPLLNFFRRMGAYTEAEDMAQQTLVRVFQYRDRYRPTAKFGTFLYTVARHVWIDALRRAKRAQALAEEFGRDCPVSDDGGLGRARARMDVREALVKLSDKLRDVVVLAVFQGLNYDQIGDVLGIPEGTVKSRMFLAIAQLKEAMGEHDGQR